MRVDDEYMGMNKNEGRDEGESERHKRDIRNEGECAIFFCSIWSVLYGL